MFSLTNKLVVITGGAGRIGSIFAEAVAENNGIAIIADVNQDYAMQVIARIKENKSAAIAEKIIFKKLDISSKESVNSLIKSLYKDYGKIDALVNNAYPKSENYGKKFFEITIDDFNEFIGLHLGGYFNISQKFINYFLQQGYGNIINISSIQGIGAPAFETYSGTEMHSPVEYTVVKHGLLGMTKYMAKMLKKDNIRINAISPGGILDSQPEIFLKQYKDKCGTKGMLNPEDLTGALLFLLSDSSKYLTGQNIIVDDGFSL